MTAGTFGTQAHGDEEEGLSVDALTLDRVMELARIHGGPRLSLYMRTSRFGPGSQEQDGRRLKNHLRTAEERLIAAGTRPADAERMLGTVRALIEDRPFWLRSRAGLAIFAGPEGTDAYQLPESVPEMVRVDSRYHLKPLVGMLGARRDFWLLTLSQKHARLYRGARDRIQEVPADGIPASLADALQSEEYERSSLQFHTGTSGTGGRRPAVFHGTGEADVKEELVRYFREIDRGLRELLKDSDVPLVLAGVDYLLPLYREVNTYPHLAEEGLTGNPDSLGDAELHERALGVVSAIDGATRAAAAARVEESWASPKTTPDPVRIVPAAAHGRVDVLFVADDATWWGSYDHDAERVVVNAQPGADDDDLLDLATLHTLLNGGEVFSLRPDEMPKGAEAVALLRY